MTDDLEEPAVPGRRAALKCMAWAGTGALWTLGGGLAGAVSLDQALAAPKRMGGGVAAPFSFLQISDSHVGFAKPANPDARATYREAVAKIAGLPVKPAFIIHTGDITQLSRDAEFDDAEQIIRETGLPVFHVPGEHDMLDDGNGQAYLDRFGKGAKGDGWYSFDHSGVHFVALINVKLLKPGGMGQLGPDQLAWLKDDLAGRSSSTPIVVFTHMPLWTISTDWGWGTDDAQQALGLLRRFGSVTVLNGHIHQVIHKLEGHVAFHTARSTAFPQPAPGTAPSPGPLVVPADRLRAALGIREVSVTRGGGPLALIDTPLAS
ncbi:MAG: metallophosphoesterase [Caulobacter sp.]|nr:metallophosphoesterase [Caulobacter sp.]